MNNLSEQSSKSKTLISTLIVLLSIQVGMAQENPGRKDIFFENPVTKKQIKIEMGNRVALRLKIPDIRITGTILALSDSSLTIRIHQEPHHYAVPFHNITSLIVEAKKKYIVKATLKSGEEIKGELIRTTQDSLILLNTVNSQPIGMGVFEIESVRIRSKGSIGLGARSGAAVGAIVGAVVGVVSYTPCSNEVFCIDVGPVPEIAIGAVLGALIGSGIGAGIGSAGKEFKIESDKARFNLFANEFK